MIKELKYIRKDKEYIVIPKDFDPKRGRVNPYDNNNPRRWKISINSKLDWHSQFTHRTIEKTFFTFVCVGEFPTIREYKDVLPILKKYKFCKVYGMVNNHIYCKYFKRGVLFDRSWVFNENDKKFKATKRLLKLINLSKL